MIRLAVALLALALAACGGGSSSSAPQTGGTFGGGGASGSFAQPVLFGFFGTGDNQLAATATFVNVVHAVDWGANATPAERQAITYRIIAQMQEARARGVDKVLLSTGYLMLDAQCHFTGVAELTALKAQLDALDLTRMVVATYPKDEPDIAGCSDATMRQVFAASRAAFPVPVAVIYGDHGEPGKDAADWVGRDRYGDGPQYPQIRDDQQYVVISGGANPWREQPYAIDNARVALDLAFLYVDFTDPQGHPQKGIGANGMLPAYCAAGRRITQKTGTC